LPLLHISSAYKGLVKINESVAGEVGNSAITTPVTPNGTFYLSFYPLENPQGRMVMPFTRRLTVGKNFSLSADDPLLTVCVWPDNVFEVEINPLFYFLPAGEDVYYREYAFFEFSAGQRQYAASVVRDFNCYFLIEETGRRRIVYAKPLPFEVEDAKLTLNRMGDVPYLMADGSCDKGAFVLIAAVRPEFKAVVCESCEAYEAGVDSVRLSGKFGSEYKSVRTYACVGGEIGLAGEEPEFIAREGKTAQETVQEFLYCMKNGMQERAMEYLTISLKDGLGYQDLKEFFGEIESTAAPLSPVRECGETVWACKYRASFNVRHARLFCFDLYAGRDGRYLIDNIKEP